jgi:predicted RecA/RadA family phage recombinase
MSRINDGLEVLYANGTGSDITQNSVVVMGKMCGIAAENIANGSSGRVYVKGCYTVAKKTTTDVIAQGDILIDDTGIKVVTAGTDITQVAVLGRASLAANSVATTVQAILGL